MGFYVYIVAPLIRSLSGAPVDVWCLYLICSSVLMYSMTCTLWINKLTHPLTSILFMLHPDSEYIWFYTLWIVQSIHFFIFYALCMLPVNINRPELQEWRIKLSFSSVTRSYTSSWSKHSYNSGLSHCCKKNIKRFSLFNLFIWTHNPKINHVYVYLDSRTNSHRTNDQHKCLKCKSNHKNGDIIK